MTRQKEERLALSAEINRLQFETVLTTETLGYGEEQKGKSPRLRASVVQALSETQTRLAALESQISAPQSELDRLTRQFWVRKEQMKANKYGLSASRYRQVDADAVHYEKPSVTLERLARFGKSDDEEGIDLSGFFDRCEKARYPIDPYGSLNTSGIAARNPSEKPGP